MILFGHSILNTTQYSATMSDTQMTNTEEDRAKSNTCREPPQRQNTIPEEPAHRWHLEYPRTPDGRQLQPKNLTPKSKAAYSQVEEQTTPTRAHSSHRRTDSGHGSVNVPKYITPQKYDNNLVGLGLEDLDLNLPKTPIREPRGDRNEGGRSASPKCPSLNRSRLQSGFYRSRSPTSTRRFIQGPFIMSFFHASEIPRSRREPDDDAAKTQPSPSCCRNKV
jgi:hypothetical protein